jgi:NAD-dependent deacetylase
VAGCAQGLLHGAGACPGRPPRCGTCGNLRRPAVVWFGEMLPARELAAAEEAAAAAT